MSHIPGPTPVERHYVTGAEVRVIDGGASGSEPGQARRITGYSALFNSPSEDLGGFIETIAPGAFRDAIPTSDIRALYNHDANLVLGRVRSGTLTVSEDGRGLRMDVAPPDTQWARDLMVSIERGDVDQQSFGFRIAPNGDEWEMEGDVLRRTITRVAELLDVSVVTYPAYPATDAAVREARQALLAAELERRRRVLETAPSAVRRAIRQRRLRLEVATW